MQDTRQILDAIFASSGYTLQDYLRDLGIATVREEKKPAAQRLLTRKQACRYLQVPTTTLWRFTKRGLPKTVRAGGRTHYDVRGLSGAGPLAARGPSAGRDAAARVGGSSVVPCRVS